MKRLIVSSITAVALLFGGVSIVQACGKKKTNTTQTQVEKKTQVPTDKGKLNRTAPTPAKSSKKAGTNPVKAPNDQPAMPAKS